MSSFLDAMALTPDGDTLVGQVGPDWAQGRAAFGGALAGLAVRAVGPRIASDRRLLSVLVDFVSPADVGPIRVDTRILRAGRALTHAEARLVQGDELRAVVVLAYAADRATSVRWPGAAAPPAVTPEGLPAFPYIEGVTPAFTQQFEYRWATGNLPFSGGGPPRIGGWVRLAEPVPVDDAVVLALLDAWPAPVLPLMNAPAPASTVTWMVDIVGAIDGEPDAWWRFAADTVAANGGHASVEARLWGSDGALVAVSRQLVAEFSRP
jgi:acyl-CoA thioesterase